MEDIGRYRLLERIAVGGMAEVFLARQRGAEGLARTVVLKRILPELVENEEFVTMFLDEARLLASLSHPNVAQVFDLEIDRDNRCIVMEYVRGPTLRRMLVTAKQRGMLGLPACEGLAIVMHIAEALAYVHTRKDEHGRPLRIVHRDLNPSNVIVSVDGAVKIIDFGIAKAASKVHETRTGVIKGTFGYMAPEQLRAKQNIDHRADLFALGVILYEVCLGQNPFGSDHETETLQRIAQGHFDPPARVRRGFPERLDRLITSCLARDPALRPTSARAVADEIADHLAEVRLVPRLGRIAELAQELSTEPAHPEPAPGPSTQHYQPGMAHALLAGHGSTARSGAAPEPTAEVPTEGSGEHPTALFARLPALAQRSALAAQTPVHDLETDATIESPLAAREHSNATADVRSPRRRGGRLLIAILFAVALAVALLMLPLRTAPAVRPQGNHSARP